MQPAFVFSVPSAPSLGSWELRSWKLFLLLVLAEQLGGLLRHPVHQVLGFPEAARVRLGAEHDDRDGAPLRKLEERGEAIASLADEAGFSPYNFHIGSAEQAVRVVDRDLASADG